MATGPTATVRLAFRNIRQSRLASSSTLAPSTEICEKFLNFFIDKIDQIKFQISPPDSDPSVIELSPSCLEQFQAISSSQLSKVVSHMKSTSCHLDVLPARLFKEVFVIICPLVLAIINHSLTNGVFPSGFKRAIVQPLLKKPSLE